LLPYLNLEIRKIKPRNKYQETKIEEKKEAVVNSGCPNIM